MKTSKDQEQEVRVQQTELKQDAEGHDRNWQGGPPKVDDGGWQTASRKNKAGKTTERYGDRRTSQEDPQRKAGGRSFSPIRRQGKEGTQAKFSGRKAGEADQGDGTRVYAQLIMYLLNTAPSTYVLQTVLRLRELATERRFRAYLRKMQ
ncbi:hypothetical protein GN958_ATG11855 [Phytophthora infestans]|uniref:Uncharacterized protein n=1 Tax=Phytophthora infestans TaxID=4787 RepID=A0A8S9UKA8_PHYIN|nr:hypothetical protein GN958_ATG11855 [Phytophthora infestans]